MVLPGSDLIQIWLRCGSDLIQTWFRFGSGWVQIWFRFGSDLGQVWIRFGSYLAQLWIVCGSDVVWVGYSLGPGSTVDPEQGAFDEIFTVAQNTLGAKWRRAHRDGYDARV